MAAFQYMAYNEQYPHLMPRPSIGNNRLAPYVPYIQDMMVQKAAEAGSNSGGAKSTGQSGQDKGSDTGDLKDLQKESRLENILTWPYSAFENGNYLPFVAMFGTAFLVGPVLEDGNGDALTMGMSLLLGYAAGGVVYFFYPGDTDKSKNNSKGDTHKMY